MLLRSQAAYMLDVLPVPAYFWELHTQSFVGWNQAFADLLGYSEEELGKLDWRDLLVPEEIRTAERAIQRGPAMKNVLWHWRKRDGRQIAVTIATRHTTLEDDDGNLREVYIGLVLAVGSGEAIPAYAVF